MAARADLNDRLRYDQEVVACFEAARRKKMTPQNNTAKCDRRRRSEFGKVNDSVAHLSVVSRPVSTNFGFACYQARKGFSMKKKLSVALLAALLCALLLPVYAQAASYVNTDANGGGWLNMRNTDSSSSTVMAYLKNGSPLSWLGASNTSTGMQKVTGPGYTVRWNDTTMMDRTH